MNSSYLHGGQRDHTPQTCFVSSPTQAARRADILLSDHVLGHVTGPAVPLENLQAEQNSSQLYMSTAKIKFGTALNEMWQEHYKLWLEKFWDDLLLKQHSKR
jgi:hypothetical protein